MQPVILSSETKSVKYCLLYPGKSRSETPGIWDSGSFRNLRTNVGSVHLIGERKVGCLADCDLFQSEMVV